MMIVKMYIATQDKWYDNEHYSNNRVVIYWISIYWQDIVNDKNDGNNYYWEHIYIQCFH